MTKTPTCYSVTDILRYSKGTHKKFYKNIYLNKVININIFININLRVNSD
jgi:hypothetical protein